MVEMGGGRKAVPLIGRQRWARLRSVLGRFLARPGAERRLLLEALWALALARALLLVLPFRRLAAMLGQAGLESPAEVTPAQDAIAGQIGWAVAATARYVPWDGRCLTQAVAGWGMLRRRGLSGTVYFGVGKANDPAGRKTFHAWLRCGSRFVTGGDGRLHNQVLTSFARKAARLGEVPGGPRPGAPPAGR